MLHDPGPDNLAAAERAVEYARMVGAEDIELNARLTLGGLMVDAGDVETGSRRWRRPAAAPLNAAPPPSWAVPM